MDIQSLFYLLASVFMILGIVVMISTLVFIWRLKASAQAFQKKIIENVGNLVKERKFASLIPFMGMILKRIIEKRNKQTS